MLACVLATVLAGAAVLGPTVERALTRVSGGIVVPSATDRLTGAVRHHPDASPAIGEHVAARTSLVRVFVLCLLAAGATVLGVIAWPMLQSSSKESEEEQPPPQREFVEEKILWTRLAAKREMLWQHLLNDQDLVLKNRIEVRHVMTCDPIRVGRSTPGKRIAELFSKHNVGHLVVCDDDNRPLGVIGAGDHRAKPDCCADEIMTAPQCLLSPRSTVGAAISVLMENSASLLPVVDNERLCGVLTPTDLMLTLHCSLQLWFRVAQTMQTNPERVEELEATSRSIDETARQLGHRVQRIPQQVEMAVRNGSAAALGAELDRTMASVAYLIQQLEDAREQIREHASQMDALKEPAPDEVTGAASREELDRVLDRLLPEDAAAERCLSLILYVADGYQRLQRQEGQEAADEHLRAAVEGIAQYVDSGDYVSRYSDDALAIVLPGKGIGDACSLGARLSAAPSATGDQPHSKPRMSIVSARRGESAAVFLRRAEAALACNQGQRKKLQ